MFFKPQVLSFTTFPILSLLLVACGGGGSSTSPELPQVINTPPVINVSMSSTEVTEGDWVSFLFEVTDDTSSFDPHQLASDIPEGFQASADDPADSWRRAYNANEVDMDTTSEFKFSITDDNNNTTTVSFNVAVKNIVKSPLDDSVFTSEKGSEVGSGAAGYIRQEESTNSFESISLWKYQFEFGHDVELVRYPLEPERGQGIGGYVSSGGTQFGGAAIGSLVYGETDQHVIVLADFSNSPGVQAS